MYCWNDALSFSPVERAFQLAQTGDYENFTQVKKALRREFNVERELVGRSLSSEITRICREKRGQGANEA